MGALKKLENYVDVVKLPDGTIDWKNSGGYYLAKLSPKYWMDWIGEQNRNYQLIYGAYKGLNQQETLNVQEYLRDLWYNNGNSLKEFSLTDKEKQAAQKIQFLLRDMQARQQVRGGPGVLDDGVMREAVHVENYLPGKMSRESLNTLLKGNPTEKALMEQTFKDYWKSRDPAADVDQLWNDFTSYMHGEVSIRRNTPHFAGVTKALGLGIPREYAAPLRDTLTWYSMRHSNALAWYSTFQSDPIAAKLLGLDTDGWGNPIPQDVKFPNGRVVPTLATDPFVKGILNEWNLIHSSQHDSGEAFMGLLYSMWLGPKTSLRDIFSHVSPIIELVKGGDFDLVAKGLARAIFSDDAIKSGAVRAMRPMDWWSWENTDSMMSSIANGIRSAGINQLGLYNQKLGWEIGQMLAQRALQNGDEAWLDRIIGLHWREMTTPQIRQIGAYRFRQITQGSYGEADLPFTMLRSNNAGGLQTTTRTSLALARWSIGRFNNWMETVWKPAEKGEFAPLVKSLLAGVVLADGLDYTVKYLFKLLPQELTLKEWFHDIDKHGPIDTAHTFFTKLNLIGVGGLLSQFALMANSAAESASGAGVDPFFEYPNITAAKSIMTNIGNAVSAWRSGGRSLSELLLEVPLQIIEDNFQLARLSRQRIDVHALMSGDFSHAIRPNPPLVLGQREEAIWRRYLGRLETEGEESNPFMPSVKMKKARSIQEAQEWIEPLSHQIAITGSTPKMTSAVRAMTPTGNSYYNFINKIQGPDAAREAMQRDVQEQILRDMKNVYIKQAEGKSYGQPEAIERFQKH